MINVAIYIVMGLIGLGLLAMLASGVRSLMFGKVSLMAMGIMAVPLLILLVLGFAMGSWAEAGIMTIMISVGLTMLGLVASGVKGIFS